MYINLPECPYCGRVRDNCEELPISGLRGDAIVTCYGCHKDYEVERFVDISFTTKKLNISGRNNN